MTAVHLAKRLPDIATVRALSKTFAVLDEILSLGEFAIYAFDRRWGEGVELASMANGNGDEYSIVFTDAGAFIRGFAHESAMSPWNNEDYAIWPGLVESVPEEFAAFVTEPAFCDEDAGVLAATVCLWRGHADRAWQTGAIDFPESRDPDGSAWLFELLAEGTPGAYCAYANDYFGVSLGPADVEPIFEYRPLTRDLLRRINPEADLDDLAGPLDTIGYPTSEAPNR